MKYAAGSTLCCLLLAACGPPDDGPPEQAASTPVPPATHVRFEDATAASGIDFHHRGGRSEHKWMPEVMGGGVAVADFDRDGAPDILLVNSGALGSDVRPAGAENRLYLNDGRGDFRDATADWMLPSQGYGMGVAVGDIDNDGWIDVALTHFDGSLVLLRNIDGARFAPVNDASGLRRQPGWATSAGFFDADDDGLLDLYVVRYLDFPLEDTPRTFRNGVPVYPTPLLFEPLTDQLWRNLGGLRFEDISAASGIAQAPAKGLALAIGDLDLDGSPEIYVANDTQANQLWARGADRRWKDIGALAGTAFDEHGREEGSMGVDFSDIDGSGLPDIAVTNFQLEATAVYLQSGPLSFHEAADRVGVGMSSRQRLSFGIDFIDVDNDGHEDLVVANGHIEDNIHLNSDTVTFAQANSLYRNFGDGRFVDISEHAGPALADRQVSRGLASGDFDGDGRIDFIVVNNEGTAQLALNRSEPVGNFVMLWLEGQSGNRSAIGARAVARIGERRIERQVMGAQSYLSVSDFRLHFGLGDARAVDELTLHWPGGRVQTITDLEGGRFWHIVEGEDPRPFVPGQTVLQPQ